jgi:hypothetical protein
MSATPHPAGPAREVIAPRHESLRKEFDNPALPGYGEARLWVVARDPRWLFAYWEFDPTEHPGVRGADGTDHVFLRVLRDGEEVESTVEILPSVGHWYVPVSQADCAYTAELGYFAHGGIWAFVARSGSTRTPPADGGIAKIGSGIRPPPAKESVPKSVVSPVWGAEEERMLGRLIAEESAKESGVRRPPRRAAN